jgi:hypothetical protein
MSTTVEMRVGALLTGLAACLCAELEVAADESDIPKPQMCTVLPGAAVAFDYCDNGGMAYSRLVGIEPIVTSAGRCAVEFSVTVEIAILRCAPMIGEEGELPTEAEQLAASMLQNFDMGLLHKVLTCCAVPASFTDQTLGPFTPIGPDGGCIGGVWSSSWVMS